MHGTIFPLIDQAKRGKQHKESNVTFKEFEQKKTYNESMLADLMLRKTYDPVVVVELGESVQQLNQNTFVFIFAL
ncbi:hypothetical protein C0J52_14328 [Blattella germanica]|nr:hypothetical protein C0J52_14328 [Blattella germanica]